MKKEIKYKSIREVLNKGHLYINGLVTIVMISVWFASIFLSNQVVPEKYRVATIFIGLISGFVLGWLYWSLAIPRWRIWAFNNTELKNWTELKIRAINERLIWPDGSIFNKTEIRTKSQKNIIAQIEKQIPNEIEEILISDVQDDKDIPSKTDYYYAKSELFLNPILLIVFISIGIYLISVDRYIIGLMGIGLAFYTFKLSLFNDLFKREKQMTISDEGITLNLEKIGFTKWSNASNIGLDDKGILTLQIWKGHELFDVTYNVANFGMKSRNDMIRRINIYLKRNQMKTEANKR